MARAFRAAGRRDGARGEEPNVCECADLSVDGEVHEQHGKGGLKGEALEGC